MITVEAIAHYVKVGDHILMWDGVARKVKKIHYHGEVIAFEMSIHEE